MRQRFRKLLSNNIEDGYCWICRGKLTSRQRRYCSRGCAELYYARFSWGNLRKCVIERDQFRCVLCGKVGIAHGDRRTGSVLEVDHIIPIKAGGPEFEMSNCRTLCRACHKDVTRKSYGQNGIGVKMGVQMKLILGNLE